MASIRHTYAMFPHVLQQATKSQSTAASHPTLCQGPQGTRWLSATQSACHAMRLAPSELKCAACRWVNETFDGTNLMAGTSAQRKAADHLISSCSGFISAGLSLLGGSGR